MAGSIFYVSRNEKSKFSYKNYYKKIFYHLKTKRIKKYFVLTPDHKINITPYWLLSFIEGEAWFYVKKVKFTLIFGIGQTITQKAVIESIA